MVTTGPWQKESGGAWVRPVVLSSRTMLWHGGVVVGGCVRVLAYDETERLFQVRDDAAAASRIEANRRAREEQP